MSSEPPKVFLATYSSTDVYESVINDCPLMRRCKDDWVNATQILKCCNFSKAKRTKILEKGVQQGLHEKIQGGYGRFQGTWIPLPDAQRLAHTYGVTPEMAPVLFFDASNPGFDFHKKTKEVNKDGTPVKRKYVKKKKPDVISSKKLKMEDGQAAYMQQQLQQGYEFQGNESFNGVSRMSSQISQYSNSSSMPFSQGSFTQPDFIPNHNIPTFQNSQNGTDYNYQMQMQMQQQQQQQQQQQAQPPQTYNYGFQQPPQTIAHPNIMGQFHHSKANSSQSTNETNWSQDEHKESDTSMSSNEEMKLKANSTVTNSSESKESYSSQLLKFFSDDNAPIPYFITNPPADFNINEAIDDEGHTPLHWAASIGNYNMIHLLTMRNANPLVVNNFGLNPLSKLISFNNCYELKNFPKVLDDLEICLINTDINGRTPLHYLCQFAKVPSKIDSLLYYLENILNKLSMLTNQNSNNKSINLIKNVIDHQDVNGDTCLHLAAKSRCVRLVKYLLSFNARDDLININQETAEYLIMKDNLLKDSNEPEIDSNQTLSQPVHDSNLKTYKRSSKHLETPTQPNFNTQETPDTQRTTIQQEEDDDGDQARVNKEQINQLLRSTGVNDDNKENIFLDSMKSFDMMSTPIQATKTSSFVIPNQQPLAVISERTTESTPINDVDEIKPKRENHEEKKSNDQSKSQTYQLVPPKLDSYGKIIEVNEEKGQFKLPLNDFNSIINNLTFSLSKKYKTQIKALNNELKVTESKLNDNEIVNEKLNDKLMFELSKIGIESFNSLSEGHAYLEEFVEAQNSHVKTKEFDLMNNLEKSQAFEIANLVSHNEENLQDNDNNVENWDLAIELTNLQIQRSKLLSDLTNKIKNYGIDDKMYKYRKLISLSCGLKIDEIDNLIDGIEESLMDTSK
ncbi:regulatory protein Swi4p [[Candida] jaroonii]|uniref:Regulatory protein Swi4p n=1 Tax=[Candida] jaroonii TaxID=467808 RepID=A0ACA9Y3Q5_9ASCO|nr:regulatory protein Swi4p [[Candida] jaroonii]